MASEHPETRSQGKTRLPKDVRGVHVVHLRQVAAQPGFLAGVLAYLADDEPLLLEFAAVDGLKPEAVAGACRTLNPSFEG